MRLYGTLKTKPLFQYVFSFFVIVCITDGHSFTFVLFTLSLYLLGIITLYLEPEGRNQSVCAAARTPMVCGNFRFLARRISEDQTKAVLLQSL